MLRFDVELYNDTHKELLKANCSAYGQIESLVNTGLEMEKEELFSYAIFVEQKPGIAGWESYQDLQSELPNFRRAWERNFDFSRGTVHANFDKSSINPNHKEAMGVGGALSFASKIFGLTEPDWQKIPISQTKDLDFEIASTGTEFVQVEAKGTVVPDYSKSHLSEPKRSIESKKKVQRKKRSNNNTMLGVIAAISNNTDLTAKCIVLDPPSVDIFLDPYKYKLLARLYFYWREIHLLSRAHFLEVLVNRINSIQRTDDYKSLDGLPLLNSRGEEHHVPDSLFETRSSVYGRSAFGEVFPLEDGQFFFYGFDKDTVEALIKQDFSSLNTLSFKSRMETDVRVSAKIPRRLLGGFEMEFKYDEDNEKEENRKTISMIGDLVHTSCGRVLGCVKPVRR